VLEAGVRAQLHCEKKKFNQKMAYADKLGVPYVVFLGEDEIKSGRVTVKDMASGEQLQVSPAMAVAGILEKIKEKRAVPPISEPAKH
jgi:histidyl-tRNA synthetase